MGMYTSRHGSSSAGDTNPRWAAVDDAAAGMFPALLEFLTEQVDNEGKPRVTSTLGVSAEDGVFKLCLTDRAQKGGQFDFKLWVSAPSVLEALGSMEKALAEGTAVWRKFPKWTPRR